MSSPDAAAASSARERLGKILRERRRQIHARYANREAFIRERGRGLSPSTFADIETRTRTSFEPATIISLEVIYALPPGWLAAALNGDIRPLTPPGRPTIADAAATLRNLVDADLPEEYLDELERQVIAADLPPESRVRIWETLKAVRQARQEHGGQGQQEAG
jgi:hypothetical protein